MNERLAVASLATLAVLAVLVAPWAAFNRETGARSAILLLPNRTIDFTGRTEALRAPGQRVVLSLSLVALGALIGAAALGARARRIVWIAAGGALLVTTMWGLDRFGGAVDEQRLIAVTLAIDDAIDGARPTLDIERLEEIRTTVGERSVAATIEAARTAGLIIRRLPYAGAALGPAAFLALVAGFVALVAGLRVVRAVNRPLDRVLAGAAVPLVSIVLALAAAAVVILVLQPTPQAAGVVIDGPLMALAGRLDTLWYAYYTLFAGSLGTVKGFADALSFSTPLIFTGLAVGFGFQAGLFNIGAPGQMILGAIFAMFVGLYVPGPAAVVLPLAIAAAALGGGLWGALPGWLKARFGANEVINTILLNFVASSLLLFMLSSNPTFAAGAVRVLQLLGVVIGSMLVAYLVPWGRRALGRRPRLTLAALGVVVLVGATILSQPQPGDTPQVLRLPFKVPGSEPKSYEIGEATRLPRLAGLFGLDLRRAPSENQVDLNVAAFIAPLGGLATLLLLGRFRPGLRVRTRAFVALVLGAVAYSVLVVAGLGGFALTVPITNLNGSFLIAIGAAVFVHFFLFRTTWGYELRATGLAPKAAEYGGANLRRNTVLAMSISGALAGLTATHYVLGGALEDYALRQSIPINDGFDGIAVALLGGNTPVGVVLAAFLFGVLKNGGSSLNITFSDLTRDVVSMILALVVLFIAAKGFLGEGYTNPLRRAMALGETPTEATGEGEADARAQRPPVYGPPPAGADAAGEGSAPAAGAPSTDREDPS
ncbi:MAG: ABC transporter permease [Trueperaceae bacterium]|nr:ABC transporter permease [Trueperaceae bacterium]